VSARKFKCTNLTNCDKALNRETIEIGDGEEEKCPGCEQKVVPDQAQDPSGKWMLVTVAVVVLAGLGVSGYLLWSGRLPSPWSKSKMKTNSPDRATVGKTLSAEPATAAYPCGLKPTQPADVSRLLQYLKQGMNYASQKKPALAIGEFQQVLKIDPNFLGAEMNIGSAHLAQKQYADAETAFAQELKLVGCLKQMSDDDLAAFAYMEETGPQPPDQKKKTQAAFFRGHLDKAEADVHYNLACLNSRRSQRDTALLELKKAMSGGLIAKKSLQTDPDLQGIRSTPEFKALIGSYIPDAGSNL